MPFESPRFRIHGAVALALLAALTLTACVSSPAAGHGAATPPSKSDLREGARYAESGKVSYYARKFRDRPTASGERYNPDAYTAAHPRLPFGTLLLVKRRNTGRYVLVRVNDRGPHTPGRVLDLSAAAARKLGLLTRGIAEADVYVVDPHSTLASRL